MRICLLVAALIGCTPSTYRKINTAGAALTVAAMACDWGQTRQAAGDGWRDRHEGGIPAQHIMGRTPSQGSVDVYFAASTAVVLLAAELVPERWRWVAYSAVVVGEAHTAIGNLETTRGTCGISRGG